jgi:hypothetical protein
MMATEDALFRTMRGTVEARAAARRRTGDPIVAEQIVEETLQEFRLIIDFDAYAAGVRARLHRFLDELLATGSTGTG